MLRPALLVMTLVLCACEPAFYQRPDLTVWEVPQDATILPLPEKSLATGGGFQFSSATRAVLARRDDGVIQARVTGQEVYYIGNNFGGATPVFVPIVLCYDLSAGKPTLTGYRADSQGDLSACPVIDAPVVTSGTLPPTLSRLNGTLVDGAQASGFNGEWRSLTLSNESFFGSTSASTLPQEEFPDFVRVGDTYTRPLVMRARMKDGVPEAVALDFAPDAVDVVSAVTANPGSSGVDLFWRERDESIFRISNDSVPLALQYLGQGVFNLKNEPDVRAATGVTLGNLVVGTEWTALFVTRGEHLNLSFRTKQVASTTFKPVRPFQPTIASTPNSRAVRVCFNEQLDVATVEGGAFTFDPPIEVFSAFPSSSQLCVFFRTAQREARAYTVTVKNLKSVFGNALPARGIQFSVNGDRERILDLATELFRDDTDSMGRPVVEVKTIAPTTRGGVVAINTDFGDTVVSRTDDQLAFVQPVEKLEPTGLDWVADARGHGLWVRGTPDAGVTTFARYDDLPAERFTLAGTDLSLVSLGDGSAIVNSLQEATTYLSGGAASPLPAAFAGLRVSGFVHGSSDALTSYALPGNQKAVQRHELRDGGVVAAWQPVLLPATQLMDDYLCAGFLYRAAPDGGTAEVSGGMFNTRINCVDLSKAPDGTVYVTGGGVTPERLFALGEGGGSQVVWKLSPEPDAPVVARPRFVQNGVFFEGQTMTRRALYFATHAQWAQLTDGGMR